MVHKFMKIGFSYLIPCGIDISLFLVVGGYGVCSNLNAWHILHFGTLPQSSISIHKLTLERYNADNIFVVFCYLHACQEVIITQLPRLSTQSETYSYCIIT